MNHNDKRKARVINKMRIDVTEHFVLFGEGAPLRDFSGRYSRLLAPLGGVRNTIEELLIDNTFVLKTNEKGHQFLYPYRAETKETK